MITYQAYKLSTYHEGWSRYGGLCIENNCSHFNNIDNRLKIKCLEH